jgi:hypothetical protein
MEKCGNYEEYCIPSYLATGKLCWVIYLNITFEYRPVCFNKFSNLGEQKCRKVQKFQLNPEKDFPKCVVEFKYGIHNATAKFL